MHSQPPPEPVVATAGALPCRGFGGWLRIFLVFPCLAAVLCGCETMSYYSQVASGQLSLLQRRQPIAALIADPETPAELRGRLELVLRLRAFAEKELHLPVDEQYRDYADLGRDHVVWNVFVAPELSLQPMTWCFPVAGCVAYRGYFSEASAQAFADRRAAEGFDTYVAGVTAYSTLGWMRDPVLNTFVFLPEPQLADLIFHELAHQLLYVPGDTLFNESFATTLALEGVRRWLHARGEAGQYAAFLRGNERQGDFLDLLGRYRDVLEKVYVADIDDAHKRREKARLIGELRAEYGELEESWGNVPAYRAWIEGSINNAKLNAVSLYHGLVPQLQQLLALESNQLTGFYRRCRQMAELDTTTRHRAIARLAEEPVEPRSLPAGD